MQNLLAPSLTARRFVFAGLFTLLVAAVFGGAIGFATAGDRSDASLPSTFAVAPAHAGDAGSYASTPVTMDPDGVLVPEGPREIVATFEWTGSQPLRLPDGSLFASDTLRYDGQGVSHPVLNGVADDTPVTYFFGPGMKILAHAEAAPVAVGAPGANQWQLNNEVRGTSAGRQVVYEDGAGWNGVCGLVNGLQGRTFSLDADLQLFKDCATPNGFFIPQPSFHAIATQDVDGRPTIVFMEQHTTPEQSRRVWFASDVPYPVRLLAPDSTRPGAYQFLELVDLRLGTQPLTGGAPIVAPATAAPTFAPWQGLVPSEAGLVHPFPLSAAVDHARNDAQRPEVKEFLDSHPDAYVAWSAYREDARDGNEARLWDFLLTDGHAGAMTCIRQVDEPATGTAVPVPATGSLPPKTSYSYSPCSMADHPRPTRAQVPAAVPTVVSLLATWQGFAGDDYRAAKPNSWGNDISCADAACTTVVARFSAGVARASQDDYYDPTLPAGPGLSYRYEMSQLNLDGTGHATGLVEFRQTYDTAPVLQPPTVDPTPAPVKVASAAATVPTLWRVPTGAYAVATGLVAALGGLLYWLWPSLKLGGAGLFSRVEKPSALEQPNRAAISALVEANPGIHFQEIGRRLSMGHGTVEHHLRKLVDVGILTQQSAGGYNCYFPKGAVDRRIMAAAPVLKADGARAILAIVMDGRRSGREISAATGLDPATVSYHVKKLAAASLVTLERSGREVRVASTDLGRTALAAAA